MFEDRKLCRCRAVRGLLVPSLHERERYCRSDEPGRCPTVRAYLDRGAPLSQAAYYALWIPPRPADPRAESAPSIEYTL
jgi:hypothetical protein